MMKDQNFRLIAAFVLGIVVGVGGFWLWQNRAVPATDTSDSYSSQTTQSTNDLNALGAASSTASEIEVPGTTLATESEPIRIENQNPGLLVVVAQANLKNPAWIVIHDDVNGKPGSILGARLFDKGKASGIVNLLRATLSGHSYIAALHTYSGMKRAFDAKLDLPVLGADGNPIMTTFSVVNIQN